MLRNFATDTRGSTLQSVGLTAGAIAFCCMWATVLLDRMTSPARFAIPTTVASSVRNTNNQMTVDYTPTGSLPGNSARPIILDPCTGTRK